MALPRGLFIAACCPLALAWSAGPSRSFGRVHSVRPRSLLSLSSAGGADKSGANTAPAANAAPLPPNRAARFGSADPGRPTRVARFIGSLLLLWTWPWILDGARMRLTGGTVHAIAAQLCLVREMSFRLLVASTCGTIMGLERKSADRPAGLRSMTLVSVGSALYTLAVIYGTYSGDPGRAAAQVCTGVGFIGAGVIWKGSSSRAPVRGVTTACAVWVSAALGVVAASGLWLFALYACGLSVTVLRVSRWYNFFIVGNPEVAKPSELRDYDEVDDHEDDDSDQRGKRST